MALNGVTRTRSVQADVNTYDFGALEAPSFCLLDVDLYRPVRSVLEALYDRLPSGAIIVVDDCKDGVAFDGALQAYREVIGLHGLPRAHRARQARRHREALRACRPRGVTRDARTPAGWMGRGISRGRRRRTCGPRRRGPAWRCSHLRAQG
ncbi:MAG: hypothetical protein IPN17_05250 [Deltaproteobacteria bacterium]|nr:hypothetical protein [Deltaproteobacteria bacterium]